MGNLEVIAEEHLMDIFSMPDLKKKIDDSGLGRSMFKQGLIDALKNDNIRVGETAQQTLLNYEKHLKWERAQERFMGGVNKVVWTINGTAPFALINVFGLSYLNEKCRIVESLQLPQEYCLGGAVLFSLAEFLGIKHAVKALYKRYETREENEETKRLRYNAGIYKDILDGTRASYSKKEEEALPAATHA